MMSLVTQHSYEWPLCAIYNGGPHRSLVTTHHTYPALVLVGAMRSALRRPRCALGHLHAAAPRTIQCASACTPMTSARIRSSTHAQNADKILPCGTQGAHAVTVHGSKPCRAAPKVHTPSPSTARSLEAAAG
jgi:hypothetical protein